MVDNHDSILVNAILDHYEQPPHIISLIHTFGKNYINTTVTNKNKGGHLTESTTNLLPTATIKLLSDLKESLMKGKIRIIYRN